VSDDVTANYTTMVVGVSDPAHGARVGARSRLGIR
jgi:hypothetical protein